MASDPYRYFRVEARELLDQLGQGALELDKGRVAPERIAFMLRLAHTLKGAARVVKQRDIADQAHAIEDALAPFRESKEGVSRDCVDSMMKALDEIGRLFATLSPPPASEKTVSVRSAAGAQNFSYLQSEPLPALRSNVDEIDVLLDGLTEAGVQLAALRRRVTPLPRTRRIQQRLEKQLTTVRSERSGDSGPKLTLLIADLKGQIEHLERDIREGVEQVDRELAQAREAAEHLRLLPASLMFVSLERAVRDDAQALGKRIGFLTSGGEVRLDAQVFAAIQSALVQAVRNAVAHGIETEAERKAAGKPSEGRVTIEVRRRGHRVVFVCRDDGRGVDLEAVRDALARKGAASGDTHKLSTEQLLQALLSGGISTANAVTQLSGRGIGLDVIREATDRLRGQVSIRTERKLGTTLEIAVPVSLAAVEALIVEADGRTLAIPLEAVKRAVRLPASDLADSPQGASVTIDGQVIPFAPLERALRRASQGRGAAARSWSTVIVEGANALAAVGIERLRGTQNLIMRPLPDAMPSDPVVAGASLDAEGHPQLILDPDALVQQVLGLGPAAAASPPRRAPLLVIDDSLTTRMLEQSILESAGYEVDLATSGEAGLEQARKRLYALFLVDVEMPGMDGFAFIERVQADPVLRDIPAILVTSRASPEDRERGKRVGARGHIVKGEFDQSEFLEKIRLLVEAP